jgi:hypothetical protein
MDAGGSLVPLIRPEIQKILRESGLEPKAREGTVDEQLNLSGLSNEALADELTHLALNSSNEALRLRALETALKVRGALKEQPAVIPSFTIIIQNSSPDLTKSGGVNPILFPRIAKQSESEN